jgi:hypothetical protein
MHANHYASHRDQLLSEVDLHLVPRRRLEAHRSDLG